MDRLSGVLRFFVFVVFVVVVLTELKRRSLPRISFRAQNRAVHVLPCYLTLTWHSKPGCLCDSPIGCGTKVTICRVVCPVCSTAEHGRLGRQKAETHHLVFQGGKVQSELVQWSASLLQGLAQGGVRGGGKGAGRGGEFWLVPQGESLA